MEGGWRTIQLAAGRGRGRIGCGRTGRWCGDGRDTGIGEQPMISPLVPLPDPPDLIMEEVSYEGIEEGRGIGGRGGRGSGRGNWRGTERGGYDHGGGNTRKQVFTCVASRLSLQCFHG